MDGLYMATTLCPYIKQSLFVLHRSHQLPNLGHVSFQKDKVTLKLECSFKAEEPQKAEYTHAPIRGYNLGAMLVSAQARAVRSTPGQCYFQRLCTVVHDAVKMCPCWPNGLIKKSALFLMHFWEKIVAFQK